MAGMRSAHLVLVVSIALWGATVVSVSAGTPKVDYDRLVAREKALAGGDRPAPRDVRRLVTEYDTFATRHENTGYADNALWNGAQLAADLFGRTRVDRDRQSAVRLLTRLDKTYPASSLVRQARLQLQDLTVPASARREVTRPAPSQPVKPAASPAPAARAGAGPPTPEPVIVTRELPEPPEASPRATSLAAVPVRVLGVRRTVTNESVRVTVDLDAEATFREERLADPPRVYFDFVNATATPALQDRVLTYSDDVVRKVRVGRRPDNSVRVAMDLEGVRAYSAFALYNPFRLVIDFERVQPAASLAQGASAPVLPPLPAEPLPARVERAPVAVPAAVTPVASVGVTDTRQALLPSTAPAPPLTLPPPAAPATNSTGSFSMARQLGLGIARIVIDPGHGGHDPGAQSTRLSEAELVLDVALRLERLLLAQPGVDVVLTRRTDTFVPLEERTVIANRERADLFLSIHANASRNRKARGVETYFLNFASNPEAAAVAARENSASGRTMHNLPDMVRAIALNNKLDESRDFARLVQDAMVRRLGSQGGDARDLGVKQAPFVVLIGAQMPSVLAEISFVTHPNEAALLRTPAYRQKIAEALFEAIGRYQRALKTTGTVAGQ
jgi:N-acetylmuramoyl-L-alanine amidase